MNQKYDPFASSSSEQAEQQAPKEKHQKKLTERMGFGKYKDSTVRFVIENDVDYMQWCVENVEWFALDEEAKLLFEDEQYDFLASDDPGGNWHPGHPDNFGDQ